MFGGILKTKSKSDLDESKKYEIPDIDLVVVDYILSKILLLIQIIMKI